MSELAYNLIKRAQTAKYAIRVPRAQAWDLTLAIDHVWGLAIAAGIEPRSVKAYVLLCDARDAWR